MKTNCFYCSYHQLKGNNKHYCADRDCTVDPYEPECNYDE